jgi:HAD superfamily hydrolase (TIGR01509 family)
MIRAIFFDLDGVLLDAKEWHYKALNDALIQLGYNPITEEDHKNKFDGLPTKVKLNKLGFNTKEIEKINTLKQNLTLNLIKENFKQNLDTLNALKILRNCGYLMALCTNSVRSTVDLFLEVSDYKWYFDVVISNQDVSKPKPSPEIYERACEKLGLHPNDVLVLEDNEYGIKAATSAGCHVLIIENGTKDVNIRNIEKRIKELENA